MLNRTARKEFALGERFACGVVLTGLQIKAIRQGKANLTGSYARLLTSGKSHEPELWMVGAHIDDATDTGTMVKLLVTHKERSRLIGMLQSKNQTLVVVRGYFSHGYFKVELAVGRRLKTHDKRQRLRQAEMDKQARQALQR